MSKSRRYWLNIHRWLGLVCGAWFVVLGLSGSYLSFYQEIDALLNPELVTTSEGREHLSKANLSDILYAAQTSHPTRFVHSVFPPRNANDTYHVWTTVSAQDDMSMWETLVDPYDVRVLGTRAAVPTIEFSQRNLSNTIYTLHYNLFLGEYGTTLAGIAGICLLISSVSGIIIWWPRNRHWAIGMRIKSGARGFRLHFDLHRVCGIYSVTVLMIVAFSGVFLSLPSFTKPIVHTFSKPNSADLASPEIQPTAQSIINADIALSEASKVMPNSRLVCLWLPGASGNAWRVSLSRSGNIGLAGGRAEVWLNPADGKVLAHRVHNDLSLGGRFLAWQLPLHDGSAAGLLGRILVCISGFMPLMLMLTGLSIWWRKKRKASNF